MRIVESLKKFNSQGALLLSLASVLSFGCPAYSQAPPPPNGIATIMLPVQQSPNGQQVATTPRGLQFPLPGAGVNGNAVQVFTGPQGGYWYVDRNGSNITLLQPGQPMPQLPYYGQTSAYAPPSQPTTQNVEVNTAPSSSGSSGSGAGGAMMAGAAGMMAGTAMGYAMGNNNNYYNGMPYGHPVYYGGGGNPYYYGAGGKPVYVNNKNVDVNAVQNQQQWYNKTIQNDPQTAQQWQNARSQQMQQGQGQFNQQRQGQFNQQGQGQFNQQAAQQAAQQGGRRGRRGENGEQGQFQANQAGQLKNRQEAGGRGGFEGRGGGGRAGGFGRRGR